MSIHEEIRAELFARQDADYAAFTCRTVPNLPLERFIGVRTPELRAFAKRLSKRSDIDDYLNRLPHESFEENQLHAFLISDIRDFRHCLEAVRRFLPYVDNWATCDQLIPKAFAIQPEALLPDLNRWLHSDREYEIRFAIGLLMRHFLDDRFDEKYLAAVAEIRSEAYYVRMMQAWYFATALTKQYERTLPWLERRLLEAWTHNRTIQKAVESYRIPEDRKAYLKTLRVKRSRCGSTEGEAE